MTSVKIGKKIVGPGHQVYIIAEAGSNHNRDLKLAKKLIDAAASAGADAVKFQLFTAGKIYPRKAGVAKYLAKEHASIYNLIKSLELPPEWLPNLADHCRKRKIDFLCTPFDEQAVALLEKVKMPAYKIASSECNHVQLIERASRTGKPIILSTGISLLEEIKESVKVIRKHHNKIILLHTIVNYPAQIEDTNLSWVNRLAKTFRCPSGLSDHSLDPIILPVAATAIGGNIIEKHFTLDKKMSGPDHRFAIEPDELKAMVEAVRATEAAMSFRKNKISSNEVEMRQISKRAIQALIDIKKGERLTESNTRILRPGKGLSRGLEPKYYQKVLTRRAKQKISEGQGIRWNLLA